MYKASDLHAFLRLCGRKKIVFPGSLYITNENKDNGLYQAGSESKGSCRYRV